MAVYEYECKKCKTKIEVRVKFIDEKSLLTCPKCGILTKDKFDKLMSQSTFRLNFTPFH